MIAPNIVCVNILALQFISDTVKQIMVIKQHRIQTIVVSNTLMLKLFKEETEPFPRVRLTMYTTIISLGQTKNSLGRLEFKFAASGRYSSLCQCSLGPYLEGMIS